MHFVKNNVVSHDKNIGYNIILLKIMLYPMFFIVGWGGDTQQSFVVLYGDALPQVQTFTLLYTLFHRKGNPFIYLL